MDHREPECNVWGEGGNDLELPKVAALQLVHDMCFFRCLRNTRGESLGPILTLSLNYRTLYLPGRVELRRARIHTQLGRTYALPESQTPRDMHVKAKLKVS